MTSEMCIYSITNETTGRMYIGQTRVGSSQRWKQHQVALERGHHVNRSLQRDAQLGHLFSYKILEIVDNPAILLSWEEYWIDHYADQGTSLYNHAAQPLRIRRGKGLYSPRHGDVASLETWRLQKRWTWRQLGKEAGVSTETLSRILRGARMHDLTARRIANALGVKEAQITELATAPTTE